MSDSCDRAQGDEIPWRWESGGRIPLKMTPHLSTRYERRGGEKTTRDGRGGRVKRVPGRIGMIPPCRRLLVGLGAVFEDGFGEEFEEEVTDFSDHGATSATAGE